MVPRSCNGVGRKVDCNDQHSLDNAPPIQISSTKPIAARREDRVSSTPVSHSVG